MDRKNVRLITIVLMDIQRQGLAELILVRVRKDVQMEQHATMLQGVHQDIVQHIPIRHILR